MSTININNSDDLKSYIKKRKFLRGLYIRELYNSLKGEKPKKIPLIIFLIKSWAFLIYHLAIVLKPSIKLAKHQALYLSPDFFYDKKLGFHKYWELLPNYKDVSSVEFVYFSSFKDRLLSKTKGLSKPIDSFFSFKSFCKLFLIVYKLNILVLSVFIDLRLKKIKSAPYIKNIYNLGTLNDYFVYFLLNDFSSYKHNLNKSIYLSGEFQFWELGLFENRTKYRFLHQHSGIRFNDPRILFFRKKNKNVNIVVSNNIELGYLDSLGFTNLIIENNYRSDDAWIKASNENSKYVFFGSLDITLDMKILDNLGGEVYYKPHPSLLNKFNTFKKIWKNSNESIWPIVYSQSAISKNLIANKQRCKVIFKYNYDMSLIEVKSKIENSNNFKTRIFERYHLIDL